MIKVLSFQKVHMFVSVGVHFCILHRLEALLVEHVHAVFNINPILDTRISVRASVRPCVTLRGPPLDSETGWTGELWSNPVLLILEN